MPEYSGLWYSRIQENPPEKKLDDSDEFSSHSITLSSPCISGFTRDKNAKDLLQLHIFSNKLYFWVKFNLKMANTEFYKFASLFMFVEKLVAIFADFTNNNNFITEFRAS